MVCYTHIRDFAKLSKFWFEVDCNLIHFPFLCLVNMKLQSDISFRKSIHHRFLNWVLSYPTNLTCGPWTSFDVVVGLEGTRLTKRSKNDTLEREGKIWDGLP